jgi:hypothetical protein
MMRRAAASASFLLRKKENIGTHPWDAIRDTPMIDPGRTSRSAEEGPGGRKSRTGALAFPGDQGGSWGTPLTIISAAVFRSNSSKKGRRRPDLCAPTPLLKCPHTRKEKISNSDDEIAAGLGRNRTKADGVEWCRLDRLKPLAPSGQRDARPHCQGLHFVHQRTGGLMRAKATRELKPSGL